MLLLERLRNAVQPPGSRTYPAASSCRRRRRSGNCSWCRVGQHAAIGNATERSVATLPTNSHLSLLFPPPSWNSHNELPSEAVSRPHQVAPASHRAGWISRVLLLECYVTGPGGGSRGMLLLRWLRNAGQPPGSRTHSLSPPRPCSTSQGRHRSCICWRTSRCIPRSISGTV